MTWQVGSWMFDQPSRPSWHNASFTVIDVSAISPPGEFEQKIRRLIDELHAAPTADGVDRVLLPGEREWASLHQSQKSGIHLPPDVHDKLRQAGEMTSVARP
jgi:LDH2 family malate/lactate/ureidoglycolate dehydrogenase